MSKPISILMRTGIIIFVLLFISGCINFQTPAPSANPPTTTPAAETTGQASAAAELTLPGASGGIIQTLITPVELPSFAQLVEVAKLSVVAIDTVTTTTDTLGISQETVGAGSGWVLESQGLIVTDNHVIENSRSIIVTLHDGRKLSAELVAADPSQDLAVIKIEAGELPVLKPGDASRLRVGDWVISIGNPLGQGISVKQGIVSRLGVTVPFSDTLTYRNLIEISAVINPGNSGGPLLNLAGEVVGITAIKVSDLGVEGMGYAMNITDALPVIRRLARQ